jgi:hypothetical protein
MIPDMCEVPADAQRIRKVRTPNGLISRPFGNSFAHAKSPRRKWNAKKLPAFFLSVRAGKLQDCYRPFFSRKRIMSFTRQE